MVAAMTDAATLTRDLGGRWLGRYGCAPCPVCQPERRRDQNALTLSDGASGLLLHCKKERLRLRGYRGGGGHPIR